VAGRRITSRAASREAELASYSLARDEVQVEAVHEAAVRGEKQHKGIAFHTRKMGCFIALIC